MPWLIRPSLPSLSRFESMIFHQHKAVFFHIPKTAGYAMEQYFAPGDLDYTVYDPGCVFGMKDSLMTQHFPYSEMIKLVPQDIMREYFKFAFVRNPWDRLYSAYAYLKELHDRLHGGFEPWLRFVCAEVRERKYEPGAHHAPQADYLLHEGIEVLDFVGRYENLQQDFATVCSKLGVAAGQLPVLNKTLLKTGHYSTHYSRAMVELVRETYHQEIAFLGYAFEPETSSGPTGSPGMKPTSRRVLQTNERTGN